MFIAVIGTVSSSLPVCLVGALAVQLHESLHFGTGVLGAVVALYYLGAGVSSIAVGELVEKIGGLRAIRFACAVSSLLLLLAATADSWVFLAISMVPAGIASTAMQLGTNLFVARSIPADKQGLAFGVNQAGVPVATSLGGLAVPVLALTVGWRGAFMVAAAGAAAAMAMVPRARQTSSERRAAEAVRLTAPRDFRPLLVLGVGTGLGVAAASALTAFLAVAAVSGGMGHAQAGLLVALGGLFAGASRIINGHLADRRGRSLLPIIAGMLTVGAIGYSALAFASARHLTGLYVPAVVIVFSAGWGWNGLFNFTIVRTHLEQPARATALTQTGGRLGAVIGPFAFGEVAAHGSYGVAWLLTAAAALCAAGVMMVGQRLLQGSEAPAHATAP